jgi:hypothetical protein
MSGMLNLVLMNSGGKYLFLSLAILQMEWHFSLMTSQDIPS